MTPLEATTRGSSSRSTPKSASSSSSHSSSSRPNSSVRDAFVTSLTCSSPSVSFHTSHESTVPNARSPLRALAALQDPLELGRREVRIGHEAGALADQIARQLAAALGGTPVLPDDRAVDWTPRRALPDDGRLALVGDPDRREIGCGDSRLRERVIRRGEHALPDLLRIVLDPAGLRKVLS